MLHVYACDDAVFADIESAVYNADLRKIEPVQGLFETYEFSCDENFQHYFPN